MIGGDSYDLPSNHFMRKVQGYSGNDACVTSIEALDSGMDEQENLFVVGDAFMQLYYTAFSRDTDQVGLAKARHSFPDMVRATH